MTKEQFTIAIEKEQKPLRRFLKTLCRGDAVTADDIAQEALLKAYLHFNDFNGKSKFSTWLYRIAYNSFIDWHTARNKKENGIIYLEDLSAITVAVEKDNKEDYKRLYMAIDGLSEHERICVLLFYMENKSIAEISNITSITAGTVKSHLYRARVHLKAVLQTLEKEI